MASNSTKTPRKRRPSESSLRKFKLVAREYCSNGFNKTAAIEKVYKYKHQTAKQNSWNIFSEQLVQDEIENILRKAALKVDFGPERVLEMMKMYAESAIRLARFKKVDKKSGDLYWDFTDATEEDLAFIHQLEVSEYTEGRGRDARQIKKFKIGSTNPMEALDKLARAYGLYQDNLNLQGEQSLVDRINAGRVRAGEKPDKTVH